MSLILVLALACSQAPCPPQAPPLRECACPPQAPPCEEEAEPVADAGSAHIVVTLPADALLWVDGVRSYVEGSERHYDTPPLGDRLYAYQVTASWAEGGRTVEHTQTVQFRAGNQATVSFERAAEEAVQWQSARPQRVMRRSSGSC